MCGAASIAKGVKLAQARKELSCPYFSLYRVTNCEKALRLFVIMYRVMGICLAADMLGWWGACSQFACPTACWMRRGPFAEAEGIERESSW